MEDITIVTAFFDIGREKMKKFERSNELYFNYFTKWAKLKNNLVVFVENEKIKVEILNFRKSINLENRTTVIVMEDLFRISPEIYKLIEKAMNNKILSEYRLRPYNPESNSKLYNYVTVLKTWCLNYVANDLNISGQLAWIDFGFNHGGTVYSLESDFNIEWKYDFGEKITLFNLQDLDDRPVFDIIFSMDTYIMGSIIIVPAKLAEAFWQLTKYSVKILSEVGLSDDDQIIWLICSRIRPELFNIRKTSGWHKALKEYGCNKLIYIETKKERKLRNILRIIKKKFEAFNYSKRIYKVASNWIQQ